MFETNFYKFLEQNTLIEIRSGAYRHDFTPIWAVEVSGRVFARSWSKTKNGWYGAFLKNGIGDIRYGEEIIRVIARKIAKDNFIHNAVDQGYLEKYTQPHNLAYVREIVKPEFYDYTIEFIKLI